MVEGSKVVKILFLQKNATAEKNFYFDFTYCAGYFFVQHLLGVKLSLYKPANYTFHVGQVF